MTAKSMEFGKYLHELLRLRGAVVVCFALSAFAALAVNYRVGLLPPTLEPRNVAMASATAEILVDTPLSSVQDLRQGATDIESMTNRAVLIGNVMTSPPVLAVIGRRAGIPAGAIQAQAPVTPDFPRPVQQGSSKAHPSDLVGSPDEYRMNVQVNPSVPIIQVYTQAPDPAAAARLANASADGLRAYLQAMAVRQGTDPSDVARITQLGRAVGSDVGGAIRPQLSLIVFLLVFAVTGTIAVLVARVRRGYDLAARAAAENEAGTTEIPGPAAPEAGAAEAPGPQRHLQREADPALR